MRAERIDATDMTVPTDARNWNTESRENRCEEPEY